MEASNGEMVRCWQEGACFVLGNGEEQRQRLRIEWIMDCQNLLGCVLRTRGEGPKCGENGGVFEQIYARMSG